MQENNEQSIIGDYGAYGKFIVIDIESILKDPEFDFDLEVYSRSCIQQIKNLG